MVAKINGKTTATHDQTVTSGAIEDVRFGDFSSAPFRDP